MRKAFLDSKWWFYLPVFFVVFLKPFVLWVFDPKEYEQRYYRHLLSWYIVLYQLIPLLFILSLIKKYFA